MFRKQYYALVAGLREYSRDADTKGFDAPAIIAEIKEGVGRRDRRAVELFYAWYDIENLINIRSGREQFSALGNFTREQLEQELALSQSAGHGLGGSLSEDQNAFSGVQGAQEPHGLPEWFTRIVRAYNASEKDGAEDDIDDLDMNKRLESNLFAAYYDRCGKSHSKFLREWGRFDMTLRNISAAFAARRRNMPVGDAVVGEDDIVSALARSSAADFGLKGEVGYIDRVMAAMGEGNNMVEKERRMDDIRWEIAEELTALSYFDIDFLLGYLVKVNIIHRWAALDMQRGEEMLKRLLGSLTGRSVIDMSQFDS